MKKKFTKLALGAGAWLCASQYAVANTLKLPSWASGDAKQKTESIGSTIVDYLGTFMGVMIILGLFYTAFKFFSGDGEGGKKALTNCLIGGLITSLVYGIAQFFV